MVAKKRMRFREFTVRADPDWRPVFTAVCVSGTDEDCGAASGRCADYDALVRWMSAHCAATDGAHLRFRRSVVDGAVVEPGAWK